MSQSTAPPKPTIRSNPFCSDRLLAWEMIFDHAIEILWRLDMGDMGSEQASPKFALCVAAGILPHEVRSFLGAESIDYQLVVMQHASPLLLQTGFLRYFLPTQCGGGLSEQPRSP